LFLEIIMSSKRRPLSTYKPKPKGKVKKVTSYGTFNRSPIVHLGSTEMRQKTRIFSRVLKYQTYLFTQGAQTFFTQCLYTYFPYNRTDVNAGTVTPAGSIPIGTAAAALFAAFQYYRVNKIRLNYTTVISTSIACPCINVAYQPGNSPFNVGGVPATSAISMIQNSTKFDSHGDFYLEYEIKRTSDVSVIGGNELAGGWLPVAQASGVPANTVSGIIATTCGDIGAPAPVNTTIGQYVVEYDISWLLGL